MKRGLLVPTGNIECDLISFVSSRQRCVTSPVFPTSQTYNLQEDNHAKTESVHRERYARPLTEFLDRRKPYNGARQPRIRSADVLRMVKSSEPMFIEWNSSKHEAASRRRADVVMKVQRCSKSTKATDVATRSELGPRQDLISSPPLGQDAGDAPGRVMEAEAEVLEDLLGKIQLKQGKRPRSPAVGKTTSSPFKPKKSERLRIRAQNGFKKSQKHASWKKSLLALPTGIDFDHLVRSGVIAKYIARKERTGPF